MTRSFRRASVAMALAIVVALLASSCVLAGTWTTLDTPNPAPEGGSGYLVDVACPTRDFCMAVGTANVADPDGSIDPWDHQSFVQTWDGNAWTPLAWEAIPYHEEGEAVEVRAVSCGSPTSCAILWEPSGSQPMFSVWDGSTWAQAPSTEDDTDQAAVACAPDGSCLLTAHDSHTLVWDGATFTDHTYDEGVWTPGLRDLACLAADDCIGLTSIGDAVVRWNGTNWGSSPWSHEEMMLPGGGGHRSIDCTATDRCVAVGERFVSGSAAPIAAVLDGPTWVAVEVPMAAGGLASVSCAAGNACVAIGAGRTSASSPWAPVAIAGTGSSWYLVDAPPAPPGTTYAAIGCGGDRCVAVGDVDEEAPHSAAYDWQPTT